MAAERTRDRLDRLEALVGEHLLGENAPTIMAVLDEMRAEMQAIKTTIDTRFEQTDVEIELMKMAIRSLSSSSNEGIKGPKTKVPDPKPFAGSRSSKEVENFLWDMAHYFKAVRTPDAEKVDLTCMFLTEDAKLWWRTRSEDGGRPPITTWEEMAAEIREQFLPSNTVWQARDNLHRLKHTGSVRDYVKTFSSLMLDIRNMSEEDKLFNFMKGLQGWAQTELRRQGVKDLSAAMMAADALLDFKGQDAEKGSDNGKEKGKEKEGEPSNTFKKPKEKFAPKDGRGCFICEGPHLARNCPKREKLNAIRVEDSGSQAGEGVARLNPLQILN